VAAVKGHDEIDLAQPHPRNLMGDVRMVRVGGPSQGGAGARIHGLAFMPAARAGAGDVQQIAQYGAVDQGRGSGHRPSGHFGHG